MVLPAAAPRPLVSILPAINLKIEIGGHPNERDQFEGLLPFLYNRYDRGSAGRGVNGK